MPAWIKQNMTKLFSRITFGTEMWTFSPRTYMEIPSLEAAGHTESRSGVPTSSLEHKSSHIVTLPQPYCWMIEYVFWMFVMYANFVLESLWVPGWCRFQ